MALNLSNLGRWVDFARQYGVGGVVGAVGTAFNAPEVHASERLGSSYPTQIPLGTYRGSGGSVQGTSTTASGGSSSGRQTGGGAPVVNEPRQEQPSQPGFDPYEAVRNQISSGWDQYLSSLDQQFEGLNAQRTSQEGIAQEQFNQGLNTLGTQKRQGQQVLQGERETLEKNQAKTLRDLSSNLRNSFMAGNVYLGARGAGDSSAASQYSLALTKEGTRQRSGVMAQTADQLKEINLRESNLMETYDTNVRNLESEKNQKLMEISQWFADAQNQIRNAKSQGMLGKNQDLQSLSARILDQAVSAMNMINNQVNERRNALESWAISKSQDINQLKSNLQNISSFTANVPGYSPIAGTPEVDSSGNLRVPMFYGGQREEEKRLFGTR